MVASAGPAMGSMILQITLISPALSNLAASIISSGICMKYWRSKKIPNALDINGMICGHNVWISPKSAINRYTGIKVICPGIMNARRTKPNRTLFPRKRYLAKAYAAGIITANCSTMMDTVITTEFLAYIKNGPALIASTKLFHCGIAGIQVGGKASVSRNVCSEVEIIHRNGKINTMTTAAFSNTPNTEARLLQSNIFTSGLPFLIDNEPS
ncbi:hypothetical protein D3C74_354290 [compost metagenome]